MNYIILAAGMGTRLHPFTKNYPKCMLNLGYGENVVQRMVRLIKKYDNTANITIVVGFMHSEIEKCLTDCNFIVNPFYSITNSISSLWFAKEYLNDDVTIINGDVVISEKLMERVIAIPENATVLLDSSIKKDGDYNVEVCDERVVVMSKELKQYHGEYVGITKLKQESANSLKREICNLVDGGFFNEWYENALVQMILNSDFQLSYIDVADYEWTEIDSVNNLLDARNLEKREWMRKG